VKKQVTCSVIGARGYAGQETARLLLSHPQAQLTHCYATSAFELPFSKDVKCLTQDQIHNHKADIVFLATPAEVSLELAPKLIEQGSRVIDLSGAFRLKASDYKTWYGFEHTEPHLLEEAVYGLAPFAGPSKGERLVANPGCYATAIELALIPVMSLLEGDVVIDAKSGTSGAGKKASETMLFTEVDGECLPYKVGKHQHYPEVQEAITQYTGLKLDAHLTTSLLPVRRGIIAGIYAKTKASTADISDAYAKAFADYPLARVQKDPPSLKRVVGTGRTHISFELVGEKLYLFSAIDNLMKGAASQAIENMNRFIDRPLETGLEHLEALT
jgi:N-acetyl-gamma-glutamyl-phosphate reductase